MDRVLEEAFPRDPASGIILGAEPFAFGSGSHAILFLHGWSSSPRDLRFLAQHLAKADFHCQGILLPGHGTTVQDLAQTCFEDYLAAAESAFDELAATHERVSLCGLSLGGLLCLYLAARRRAANLILCAPFLVPAGKTFGIPNRWLLRFTPPSDRFVPKSGGGPIFDPEALKQHIAYSSMPMRGILSAFHATLAAWPLIPGIVNPTLVFHSPRDHTSDISGSRRLLREIGSREKQLVLLEKSKHVVTLDYDRSRIEVETLSWLVARK